MGKNGERSTVFGVVGLVVLLAYSAWAIWSAYVHGMLVWGALGAYSPCPYVLMLGLLCSGFVFMQGIAGSLRHSFLLLFLGYGFALTSVEPVSGVPVEMRWVFDFIACTTGFTVIAAGLVLDARLRGKQA